MVELLRQILNFGTKVSIFIIPLSLASMALSWYLQLRSDKKNGKKSRSVPSRSRSSSSMQKRSGRRR